MMRIRKRAELQGCIADYVTRMDFVILDELGYLFLAGRQLLFHLVSRLYEAFGPPCPRCGWP